MLSPAQINAARGQSGLQPLNSDGTPPAPQPGSFLDSIQYQPKATPATTPAIPGQSPVGQQPSPSDSGNFKAPTGTPSTNPFSLMFNNVKNAFQPGGSLSPYKTGANTSGLNPDGTPLTKQQAIDQLDNTKISNMAMGASAGLTEPIVQGAGAIADAVKPIAQGLGNAVESGVDAVSDAASSVGDAVKGGVNTVKEAISPSLTPEEKIGSIIPNAKLGDVPVIQRTLDSLPASTGDVTKLSPQDLSEAVGKQIQSNLDQASAHYAGDTSGPRPMSSFETTTGTGTNEVKTNYVQQAIDQLKTHYTATNDAQGLSDIKALEEKANTVGLTSQELDRLAKEHGTNMPNAFSKATGEPLSGLNKQATENTRAGVKATARNVLAETNPEGAAEVTKLDKATSEGIKTQDLIDKQAETQNTAGQKSLAKNGKPNVFSKVLNSKAGKIAQAGLGAEGLRKIITGGF